MNPLSSEPSSPAEGDHGQAPEPNGVEIAVRWLVVIALAIPAGIAVLTLGTGHELGAGYIGFGVVPALGLLTLAWGISVAGACLSRKHRRTNALLSLLLAPFGLTVLGVLLFELVPPVRELTYYVRAKAGDVAAMAELSDHYVRRHTSKNGYGAKAAYWRQQAAEAGHSWSPVLLARIYNPLKADDGSFEADWRSAIGAKPDASIALAYYQKAAMKLSHGNEEYADLALQMARAHDPAPKVAADYRIHGPGTPQLAEALVYYEIAAKFGNLPEALQRATEIRAALGGAAGQA